MELWTIVFLCCFFGGDLPSKSAFVFCLPFVLFVDKKIQQKKG